MEGIIILAAAELLTISTLKTIQEQKRLELLQKWKEGKLTMPELLALKRSRWFQKRFVKIPILDKVEKLD